jgi:hypothetical protein
MLSGRPTATSFTVSPHKAAAAKISENAKKRYLHVPGLLIAGRDP